MHSWFRAGESPALIIALFVTEQVAGQVTEFDAVVGSSAVNQAGSRRGM
jgi:hypothetical protein